MSKNTKLFFQDYIRNILNKKIVQDLRLKDTGFRKFILEKKGKNLETIKLLSGPLLATLQKPQQLFYSDIDYYFARDLYTNTFYLCYKNLMVIDIDIGKDPTIKETLTTKSYLEFLDHYSKKNPELSFEIYKSRNGLHLFMVDKTRNYQEDSSLDLMLELKSDFFYIIYSYLRGWSVRLNKKIGEKKETYQFITKIGSNVNPHLSKLVRLHFNLADLLSKSNQSSMK